MMTTKELNGYVSRIKSVHDMKFWMSEICDTASRGGEYHVTNAYDAALYYLTTGRLSGTCELALVQNIRKVLKRLNSGADDSYEAVGNFLKGFDP
jgi:hypothetical protein